MSFNVNVQHHLLVRTAAVPTGGMSAQESYQGVSERSFATSCAMISWARLDGWYEFLCQ